MEEYNNYPELRLESSVIKMIVEFRNGNSGLALKILKKSLKECFSRDLALIISELRAGGKACDIMINIPEKTISKIEEYILRPSLEMDQDTADNYRGFQKRLEKFYKTAMVTTLKQPAKSVQTAESRL
jgi:hypothetical protein